MDRGDRVQVVMSRNDIFPWQSGPRWEGTLVWTPSGPGDVFVVRIEQPEREFAPDISEYVGRKVNLNGNSSEFVAMYPKEDT